MEFETEDIYFAGGCLWGVQAFVTTIMGVTFTEAGRINGTSTSNDSDYDGYAECVRTRSLRVRLKRYHGD